MIQSDLRHVTLNTSDVQLISHLNYDQYTKHCTCRYVVMLLVYQNNKQKFAKIITKLDF